MMVLDDGIWRRGIQNWIIYLPSLSSEFLPSFSKTVDNASALPLLLSARKETQETISRRLHLFSLSLSLSLSPPSFSLSFTENSFLVYWIISRLPLHWLSLTGQILSLSLRISSPSKASLPRFRVHLPNTLPTYSCISLLSRFISSPRLPFFSVSWIMGRIKACGKPRTDAMPREEMKH